MKTSVPQIPIHLDAALIRTVRAEIRDGEGVTTGCCHLVAEWIELEWGWPRSSGAYLHQDGRVRCLHYWNILPDGSILDVTADQFDEGGDIVVARPTEPAFNRYRQHWSDEDEAELFAQQQHATSIASSRCCTP